MGQYWNISYRQKQLSGWQSKTIPVLNCVQEPDHTVCTAHGLYCKKPLNCMDKVEKNLQERKKNPSLCCIPLSADGSASRGAAWLTTELWRRPGLRMGSREPGCGRCCGSCFLPGEILRCPPKPAKTHGFLSNHCSPWHSSQPDLILF